MAPPRLPSPRPTTPAPAARRRPTWMAQGVRVCESRPLQAPENHARSAHPVPRPTGRPCLATCGGRLSLVLPAIAPSSPHFQLPLPLPPRSLVCSPDRHLPSANWGRLWGPWTRTYHLLPCCRGQGPRGPPRGHPSPPALWCHRWERLLTRLRPLPTDTCHRQPDAPSPRRGQPPAQPRPSLPHQPHLLKRCLRSLLNPLHSDCCPGVAALGPLLPSAPWGRAHWPGGPNPAWPSGGCDWLIASSFSKRSPLSHFLSG